MQLIEERLAQRGFMIPKPWALPAGVVFGASHVRVYERLVFVSAHFPLDAEGNLAGPFGKVGIALTIEQAQAAARATMLGILASIKRERIELERIDAWLRVCGVINAAAEFNAFPTVMNGASEVIEAGFGPSIGAHARVATGAANLAWNAPLLIEAELMLKAR